MLTSKKGEERYPKDAFVNKETRTKSGRTHRKQKKFSAKDLRKVMKEYEKQDLKEKKKGPRPGYGNTRRDSTVVDSLAEPARWPSGFDPFGTPHQGGGKSYPRLDSLIILTKYQNPARQPEGGQGDTTKNGKSRNGAPAFWANC